MGRPPFHPTWNTLTAIALVGAMSLTIASPAATMPWQKSWGDYDSHNKWHDASWWLQNWHDWVTSHHPEWTENYAGTPGQIGDSDQFHVWHYGDGGFDRLSNAVAIEAAKNEARRAPGASSMKPEASVKSAPKS